MSRLAVRWLWGHPDDDRADCHDIEQFCDVCRVPTGGDERRLRAATRRRSADSNPEQAELSRSHGRPRAVARSSPTYGRSTCT